MPLPSDEKLITLCQACFSSSTLSSDSTALERHSISGRADWREVKVCLRLFFRPERGLDLHYWQVTVAVEEGRAGSKT